MYAMYETFRMSRQGADCTSFKDTFVGFLYHKKMFIFHHFVFIAVAIPFAVSTLSMYNYDVSIVRVTFQSKTDHIVCYA